MTDPETRDLLALAERFPNLLGLAFSRAPERPREEMNVSKKPLKKYAVGNVLFFHAEDEDHALEQYADAMDDPDAEVNYVAEVEELDYTVTVSNTFQAENPIDAVKQMVAYVTDEGHRAGYRVVGEDDSTNVFIDAEELFESEREDDK